MRLWKIRAKRHEYGMWNLISSMGRRNAFYQEILESSPGCVLMLDRDRCIVDANESATRVFTGPDQRPRDIEQIGIDWLITDVINGCGRLGDSLEAFLDSDAGSSEHRLNVIARRLDGMKFHATVRIVPTEDHPKVSHILYLHEAYEGAAF